MANTLILYTEDITAARAEITRLGGSITVQLSSKLLLVNLPDSSDSPGLRFSTPEIPDDIDDQSKFIVNSWRRRVDRVPSDQERATDGLKWDTPGYQAPQSFVASGAALGAQPRVGINSVLQGQVALMIIPVSGPGGLSFTTDEQENLYGQVMEGTSWLAAQAPQGSVEFQLSYSPVAISGDTMVFQTGLSESPAVTTYNNMLYIFHQGDNGRKELWYNVWDGRSWLGDVQMPQTGTSASPSAAVYDNKLYCLHHGDNDNNELWYNVFDGVNWAGDLQVPQTRIGESPSAVTYDNKLYCFHQDGNGRKELWYNVFDGTNWAGEVQVPQTGLSDSPSAVVYNGRIYCFHHGDNSNNELWYNVFDGASWAGDVRVPQTGIGRSPNAVIYNNQIYCFHQAPGDNGQLFLSIFDGSRWAPDIQISGVGMSMSPGAGVLNNRLLCFHQGLNNDTRLWFTPVPPVSTSSIYEQYESIWRDPALNEMGYPPGFLGVSNFINNLVKTRQTPNAYLMFFTKYVQAHFAYAYNGEVCMQYSNDGWGPDNIYKVAAHESSHIFGAADEYGGCGCGNFGQNQVPNGNCVNCTSNQVECVMNSNALSMCEYTKGQLGWPFPGVKLGESKE